LYSQDVFSPVVLLEGFPPNPVWIEIGTVVATGETEIGAGSAIGTGGIEIGTAVVAGVSVTATMKPAENGTVLAKWLPGDTAFARTNGQGSVAECLPPT
jgi:hypothetical protein